MSTLHQRRLAGTPVGGQFAPAARAAAETTVQLSEAFDPDASAAEHYAAYAQAAPEQKWPIACAAARAADERGDESIETPEREDRGEALDRLTPEQRTLAMQAGEMTAEVDPAFFGGAVFDAAHQIIDDAEELRWRGRYEQERPAPVMSEDEVHDVYGDDAAKLISTLRAQAA